MQGEHVQPSPAPYSPGRKNRNLRNFHFCIGKCHRDLRLFKIYCEERTLNWCRFSIKPTVTMISNSYYSMIKIQWYMYHVQCSSLHIYFLTRVLKSLSWLATCTIQIQCSMYNVHHYISISWLGFWNHLQRCLKVCCKKFTVEFQIKHILLHTFRLQTNCF